MIIYYSVRYSQKESINYCAAIERSYANRLYFVDAKAINPDTISDYEDVSFFEHVQHSKFSLFFYEMFSNEIDDITVEESYKIKGNMTIAYSYPFGHNN